MNKFLSHSLLVLSLVFTSSLFSHSFEKLTPKITKQATQWNQELVQNLNSESLLMYLNLFALNADNAVLEFMKCAEYLEADTRLFPFYEKLGQNILSIMKEYYEEVEQRIAQRKDLSDKEKEVLWRKLETKIQELVAHINSIYYKTLYNSMITKHTTLFYAFDENGLISKEKRSKVLPEPQL